ncbi:MAG: acetate--CoA ligase family protein [Thermodesulfobacteriota bacterium]|nr:acetate--CoA ligase family protein [Thermodesulfobacteriota bacterium]
MKRIEYPNLEPLFRPRSIAVIGASDDVMKPSGLPLKYALDHGYKGKLFPVNPNRETVQGLKAYPSIADILEDVDACVIVIPAAAVPKAVQQCADRGVKAAVIGVSGFAELDEEGKKRQNEIEEIAKRSGIRICGPNTNGLLNVHEGISLGYSYAQEVVIPGKLGYVSQSGALLSATVPRFTQRGVGMSYFVGAGNQADLEVFDYVRYLIDDPNTNAIAVYVEGFKDPQKFLNVADLALEEEKPIVMLKVGRSELAARAAKSHTGSLVGSDAVVDAICKQKGVTRVDDFDELIAVSSVFLKCKPPKGNRIGVISSSGGAIGMVADRAMGTSLNFTDVSVKTKEEASKVLPWYGEFRSPFDIAAAGSRATQEIELARAAVNYVLNDEGVDILLAIITPMDRRGTQNYIQAIVETSRTSEKPVVLFSPMAGLREEEEKIFAEGDIPILADSAECVKALDALIKFGQTLERRKESKGPSEPPISVNVEEIKEGLLKLRRKILSEHESKELLSCYGIPSTKETVVGSTKEAVEVANELGYPVVLKIDSPDITHKTDAGAIKLGISNQTELIDAYNEIITNSKKYAPDAKIRGVLVQEMVKEAREIIVGMSHDPQFGPVIMFGLGGVFVEVFKDVSLRVAPLTRADTEDMIKEVRGYEILKAFRGKPEADAEGIIDILLKVSRMAIDLGDIISEIDINPLMVLDRGKGVKAVDALLVLRD